MRAFIIARLLNACLQLFHGLINRERRGMLAGREFLIGLQVLAYDDRRRRHWINA